jgi:hypothetical protein
MDGSTEKDLQDQLAQCYLNHSWRFCILGLALAVPLGVRLKSYNYIAYFGLGGTALDLLNGKILDAVPTILPRPLWKAQAERQLPVAGYNKCEPERRALQDCQNRLKTEFLQENERATGHNPFNKATRWHTTPHHR